METWQADHILDNFLNLILNTSCDTNLLAYLIQHKVFGDCDIEELNSERNPRARAFQFYRKILTKGEGAFEVLQAALENSRQSGAATILRSCSRQQNQASNENKPLASIAPDEFIPDQDIGTKDEAKAAIALYHFEMDERLKKAELRNAEMLPKLHNEVCKYIIEWCSKRSSMVMHEQLSLIFELQEQFKKYERLNQMTFNGNKFSRVDSEPAIGIDLGTTNCCVGLVWDKKVVILQNKQGAKTTPSYIFFDSNGTKVIGHVAKKNTFSKSKNTIFDSKRILGKSMRDLPEQSLWPFDIVSEGNYPKILANGARYSAWEISGILLKECKEIAERHLQREVRKAVITVPAYFQQNQIMDTQKAANSAGLEILAMVNEPTAAAIAYRESRLYQDTSKILVFDLGGGTFDVAVLELVQNEIKTKAVTGDTNLGGEDFDAILMTYCIEEFKKQTKIDLNDSLQNKNVARSKAKLRLECEEKKKDLGCASSAVITVDSIVSDIDMEVKITKEKFEELCEPYFAKMIHLVDKALRDAQLRKNEIDDVILVGGSTRIPKIQEKLTEYFNGKKLNYSINPDEAVAYGAAIHAAIKNDKEAKSYFNLEKVEDVVAHSVGIEVVEKNQTGLFSVIIPKNTIYPTTQNVVYRTSHDNQEKASIKIYQGESPVAKQNYFLGEFILEGIPAAPANRERIVVEMKIDPLGLLVVSATSQGSGTSKKLTVTLIQDP